ncbi:hypothetical protein HPB47_025583 [Ixodes persulcatus]|uniref:Uncharacterized protein n=1 Tax=Ixodes persulcatus TaxID=34615 RepID=A0AC60Q1A2_IXOPE|nr:hypothetical protein HPB47_025583 [Ixodes persulcatus]
METASVPTLFKYKEPQRPPIERGEHLRKGDEQRQPSDDPLYCPEKDDCDMDDDETNASTQPVEADRIFEAKFLVFESCLRELLDRCLFCGAPHCKIELDFVGTMVRAAVTCPASHTRTWRSQTVFHRRPMGNISVCAATLFTGSSPTKVLRLFSLMGMQSLQKTSFFKIQRCYLVPAVTEVWLSEQATLLDKLRGRKLCLAGDGRADTPGHSADFGTYTLLETTANRVIHTELVKSTEVSSSNRMEAEGLQRCLNYLRTQEMSVDILVTDRHSEGKASLRDHYPEIKYRFDVWHVAKEQTAAACGPLLYSNSQLLKHGTQGLSRWLQGKVPASESLDALPRSAVKNCKQFNGYFGCGWCYHPGGSHCPYLNPAPEQHSEGAHTLEAETPGTPVNGVKGLSLIMKQSRFNPIDGFIPDYQHCLCLGEMQQLLKLWLDTGIHDQLWYVGTKIGVMHSSLLGILPPTEITRTPRRFEERAF